MSGRGFNGCDGLDESRCSRPAYEDSSNERLCLDGALYMFAACCSARSVLVIYSDRGSQMLPIARLKAAQFRQRGIVPI